MDDKKDQMMRAWKKSYIGALIDALHPEGDVLQVGFGLGDAARHIQSFNPKSHTIIEMDQEIAKEAQQWISQHPKVSLLVGNWEKLLPKLGEFDAIFFNDFPHDQETIQWFNPEKVEAAAKKTKEMKDLLGKAQEQFSQIKISYSDEQIDEFYQQRGQFHKEELGQFFQKLKNNGNISEEQYENAMKKYGIQEPAEGMGSIKRQPDSVSLFLEECLQGHMHKGSRFTAFLSDPTSKYDDPPFFEHIITNPSIGYKEKIVTIDIPRFSEDQKIIQMPALVMIVERLF